MPETQKASSGWNGEFWLHNGTALVQLIQVVSFTLPQDEADEVETTHLKSPNRRREYVAGLIDGGEFEVTLNYRPGSDTDVLLRAAAAAGDARAFKAVIPEQGTLAWDITGTVVCRGYDRGEVNAEDKLEATATFRLSGALTEAAHV